MLLGRSCALALASLTLIVVSPAQADVPRRRGPCDRLELGAACEERGQKGTCVESTCPRLSYANGERKTVRYPCRICAPPVEETPPAELQDAGEANQDAGEADPSQAPAGDSGSATKRDEGPGENAAPEAKAEVKAEVIAAGEAPTPAQEPERKGLCTVDPSTGGAPLLGLFGLALLRRRRR